VIGVILAGGTGSRLWPMTAATSKQLLPIYDKPLIYYPLSTLISANIREILIISTPQDELRFRELLGGGQQFGVDIRYAVQSAPKGIAEAITIAYSNFDWKTSPMTLILGDNIFDGSLVKKSLRDGIKKAYRGYASVFLSPVADPERYGVATITGNSISKITEKPKDPDTNLAVTGMYVYPPSVFNVAKELQPSARGELEITDVNQHMIDHRLLEHYYLGPGTSWLDTGTPESLLQASHYVQTIQVRQERLVGSPELAAVGAGLITPDDVIKLHSGKENSYSKQLVRLFSSVHLEYLWVL
jgi:glucose-1-phosphate thymidylyltransferase